MPYLKKSKITKDKLPTIGEEISYDTEDKYKVDAAQDLLNYFKINYDSLEKLNVKFQEYQNAKDEDKKVIMGDIIELLHINKESYKEEAAKFSSLEQLKW